MSFQAEAVVDLGAIADNVAAIAAHTSAEVMPAVKADGYGHGLVPVARACVAGGADRLGVATLPEAFALREAGITVPVLAWLIAPGADFAAAAAADIEVAATSVEQLEEIARTRARRRPRVHLKADTGMGRSGVMPAEWQRLAELAAKAQADGHIEVVGAFSHLARADEVGHATNDRQRAAFEAFGEVIAATGLRPRLRHLANSAATLADPSTHYDVVRPGIAVYGYPPVPTDVPLRPAMTLRARLVAVKHLPADHGIGYGHTFVTEGPMTTAIAPLGYADGIPRGVSNIAEVLVNGQRVPLRGRVSMDQVVLDVSRIDAHRGDVAEFFGPGEITADDWAGWHGTIPYEILTSVGARATRRYLEVPH